MRLTDFNHRIETDFNAHIAELRGKKADEYATDADTLLNFHDGGRFLGELPSQYLFHLMYKHFGGIKNGVMSDKRDPADWCYEKPGGGEGFKQRLADMKIYCDLLFACLDEEYEAAAKEVAA